MGEINSKSTKAEMLEAYKEVKAKLDAMEAMKDDPRKSLELKEAARVAESAKGLVEKGILSDEIVGQYNDLKTEISRMEKHLKDVYGIEVEANSMISMINAGKEKKVNLENDYKNRETELKEEFNAKKEELLAEVEELKVQKEEALNAIKEQNKAEKEAEAIRRKREAEEYAYDTKRNRQKEDDAWADEKAAREKVLAEKEAYMTAREKVIIEKEEYIAELESKVAEIPTLVETAKTEGISKGKADADKSNVFEVRALKKENEYTVKTLESKIAMLESQLASEQSANKVLQDKLDSAYTQMRELAAETVKSTGGVKILNNEMNSK